MVKRAAGGSSGSDAAQVVTVDGHRVKLTHLDKVLYPETGTTKAEVIDYYARIAPVLLPHAANRAVTRKRWVHGVGTEAEPGQVFFQKNLEERAPEWILRRSIEHSSHANEYPLVNDRATLTWLAQMSALELHVPQWQFGRTGQPQNPDRIVLDFDPGPGTGLLECAVVARSARSILQDMGLNPLPVTSGSKGIHLYAALDGTQTSDQISSVAHELARVLEADLPELAVSDMKKSLRIGKVLVDWSQNSAAKTTIAPYSLRGRMQPTVAAPRTWTELDADDLAQLSFDEVLARVQRDGDLLAGLTSAQSAPLEPTPQRMATFDSTDEARDRLAKYRSMRDASKTPEPVPMDPAVPGSGRSFVIQEHHARRLHYDFRLEHDGVLVSWAVPKGVPTDTKKNHLAVQTEDHPLEYGTFEGTIPHGEYGGGQVTIWDAGSYDEEKWRDREVIVVLHGTRSTGLGEDTRVALIKTSGDEDNWLMHRMALPTAVGSTGNGPRTGEEAAAGDEPAPAVHSASNGPPVSPMLATAGISIAVLEEEGGEWAFEMKWDGIRAIAVIDAPSGSVTLSTRNRNDVTGAYPELDVLPAKLSDGVRSAVLDGEIVALSGNGRPDFGRLQQRMGLSRPADVDRVRGSFPVHYFVFDILELDGRSLLALAYDDRRRILSETLSGAGGAVQVPAAFAAEEGSPSPIHDAFASSMELGLEGIVAKRRRSTYTPGRRSASWVKLKHFRTQEVVVGGWRPGKGRRSDGVGSLLLGVHDETGLRYVGRVGTGFGERELARIADELSGLERPLSPFVDVPRADAMDAHWVSPSLVGEVEFAEWTATGRLRQPSWRGWRPDKNAVEVVREP